MLKPEKRSWKGVVGAVALTMSLTAALPGAAFAAGNATASGANCNWEVPTAPITNTVTVDGQVKKVITTWQNAWGTSGADYLGISNSSILNSAGSAGSSGVQNNLTDAQNSTLLGAWASTANEVPNAYNWNSFYQFYVDVTGQGENAPFTCWYDTSYDSGSGVLGPFKYRPEIVGSSRLSADQENEAVKQINEGKYYQSDGTYTNEATTVSITVTTAAKITAESDAGYAVALADAQQQAAAKYADFDAATATASLKSSDFRIKEYSNAKLTAQDYAALGGADQKTAVAYDEASASDALKAQYATAFASLSEADQALVTGATYTITSASGRGAATYTIAFTFTFSDYATTFDFGFNTSTNTSQYYVPGDETYDPYRFAYSNASPFSFVDSFHTVADGAEQIIADFAGYTGTATDWKGMNTLPRATRYEAVGLTARDCATNVEKLMRGSIYYTMAKIADGTTTKKTVAYLSTSPDATSTTATIGVFDYIDSVGQGLDNGYAGASTLTVNQLGADDYAKGAGATYTWSTIAASEAASSTVSSDTSGKDYAGVNNSSSAVYQATVDADYLVNADVIECLNGSMSASELRNWVKQNCTTEAGKAKADTIQYLTNPGMVMSSANFTSEKLMNTIYIINFAYPELFPNLELMAYWYDEVYHLNTNNVAQALQWGFANATMPSDTELADVASSYSIDDMDKKFFEGYTYYAAEAAKGASSSDATIARLSANQGLNGSTTFTVPASGSAAEHEASHVFENWKASQYYAAWAAAYEAAHPSTPDTPDNPEPPAVEKKSQTISVDSKIAKTYKVKKLKSSKQTFKIGATASTTVKYTVKKADNALKVSKKGVVTVKKGTAAGTYKAKVKITAPADDTYEKAEPQTIAITVKVKK